MEQYKPYININNNNSNNNNNVKNNKPKNNNYDSNNNTDNSYQPVNPFTHQVELVTLYDQIRTAVFTVTILPVRILIGLIFLILCWISVTIMLYGLTEDYVNRHPIKGWRMDIMMNLALLFFRLSFAAVGFHHVRIRGERSTREEAPILVAGPHSTFFDLLPVTVLRGPAVVSSTDHLKIPIVGTIIQAIQPVFVDRRDRNSRQKTIQSVINRVTSAEDWPQVLIFPEGTCTNRSCLLTFKLGAFHPGLPVQPVLFRYPNKTDTLTWTWNGPGALKLFWLTLTKLHTNCEIEFLPVYTPNDEEKKNPELYAQNVRSVMAKALGIPTSDYSFDDCSIVKKSIDLGLSPSSLLIVTQKLRNRLGITQMKVEEEWMETNSVTFKNKYIESTIISKSTFAKLLGVKENHSNLKQLFQLYSEKEKDDRLMNWRHYLLAVHLMNRGTDKEDMVRLAFKYFDERVDKYEFQFVMRLIYSVSNEESANIFENVVPNGENMISYEMYLAYCVRTIPVIPCENDNSQKNK